MLIYFDKKENQQIRSATEVLTTSWVDALPNTVQLRFPVPFRKSFVGVFFDIVNRLKMLQIIVIHFVYRECRQNIIRGRRQR